MLSCLTSLWYARWSLVINGILMGGGSGGGQYLVRSPKALASDCVSVVFVCIGINNIKKHKYLKLY